MAALYAGTSVPTEDAVSAYDRPPSPADEPLPGPTCPRCHGPVERVRRHLLDRVLSLVVPVRRYRCHHFSCQWEGLRRRRRPRTEPARA